MNMSIKYRPFFIICAILAGVLSVFAQDAKSVVDTDSATAAVTADTANAADSAVSVEPSTAAVAVKDSVIADSAAVPRGLDLDKLLAEDDGDDLLAEEKPAIVEARPDSAVIPADSSLTPAAKTGGEAWMMPDGEGWMMLADSTAMDQEKTADAGKPGQRGRGGPARDEAETGPAVIEDGRTINFAQNLKEYRSPKIAMLLSLLVPGLGQAYSRDYIKAGAFGAVEAATIGVAIYLNSVGKTKKREAHEFADKNFSIEELKRYDTRLEQEMEKRGLFNNDSTPITSARDFYDEDFFDAAERKQPYFYTRIRDDLFTPGWKDNEFDLDEILELEPEGTLEGSNGAYGLFNTEMPGMFYLITRVADQHGNRITGEPRSALGYSRNQAAYNSMVDKANSYHDAVNYTFYVLLVNHIASAIDAGFTARAHNARLLGNESVLERITVEQQYVFTGSEVSPGLALRVRF